MTMSEKRPEPRVLAWVLSVAAALVVYLLSVPWVQIYLLRPSAETWSAFQIVDIPTRWFDNTPLEGPLHAYWKWCFEVSRR